MMAFVTATPQPVNRWFSNHVNSPELPVEFSKNCEPCQQPGPALTTGITAYRDERLSTERNREHIITQSATHLNCYDTFRLPKVTLHPIAGAHCATPQLSRTCSQRLNQPIEPVQHRSMIELDQKRVAHYPTVDYIPTFEHAVVQTPTPFRWIRHRTSSSVDVTHSPGRTPPTSGFMRFTIQDLMQQESCVGSVNYLVDQPSKLVRIECRKPGCRCVLKNEPALALKIVSGVTLVQGHWLLPSKSGPKSPMNLTIQTSTGSTTKSRGVLPLSLAESRMDPSPVVLTSCCPSWFELISRPSAREGTHIQCTEVPVWSSGKALWRAKPRFFLLRKPVQCLVGAVNQPLTMSVADVCKPETANCNLDASNAVTLRAGTVLELLDCRACRLVTYDQSGSNTTASGHLTGGLLSRHRGKTVPMLQCAVVGAKALVPVASTATDLSMKDGLQWLTDGPRLVYLSLDSKSISCSPVAAHATNHPDIRQNTAPHKIPLSSPTTMTGVHSLFSLLNSSQLPGLVRPLTGLRPNEWFPLEKVDRRFAPPWEFASLGETPLLLLEHCYHGDLIFLEPLSDCTDPMHQDSHTVLTQSRPPGPSRFFVVTTDMLAQHNFFLADAATSVQYTKPLELHACRVAHFLAACHPAQGLAYLIKHLEDISSSLDTGPSHVPLTRTLGPVNSSVKYAPIQAALMSVAASAALATEDSDDLSIWQNNPTRDCGSQSELNGNLVFPWGASSLSSIDRYQSSGCLIGSKSRAHSSLSSSLIASETDQMNALCDEIEDIYFYVRNGRFPAQSRSMTSLVHHVTPVNRSHRPIPQTSAPISPQADELFPNGSSHRQRTPHKRGSSRGRHASVETSGAGKLMSYHQQQQQQQLHQQSQLNQPMTNFVKRPEKSQQIYMPRSLADLQKVPILTTIPDPTLDMGTLMSPKARVNQSSTVQNSNPETRDNSPKDHVVRLFQSPAHDSGVDIAVHRSLGSGDRSTGQSPHPCKVYTNTRILTMSSMGNGPNVDYRTAMSQSQITSSQPILGGDLLSSRDRKRSTDSASAFRLPIPRGTPGGVEHGTESGYTQAPMMESVYSRPYKSGVLKDPNHVHYPITSESARVYTGSTFDRNSYYSTVVRVPEEQQQQMAKSPLRVIDLRHSDSNSLGHLQNHPRILSFSTNIPLQSVSCASANSPSATVGTGRSYCLCQPTAHCHPPRVPSTPSSTHRAPDPSPVYQPEAMWSDLRIAPVTRFHPQPVFMMLNPAESIEDEEQAALGWGATVDPNSGYTTTQLSTPIVSTVTTTAYVIAPTSTVSRQTKHRTELTNSSPDTGIGGESGVEIPCTVLSHPCGTNISWPTPPIHIDVSDRMGRGNVNYSGHVASTTTIPGRSKQIYQI